VRGYDDTWRTFYVACLFISWNDTLKFVTYFFMNILHDLISHTLFQAQLTSKTTNRSCENNVDYHVINALSPIF
jgi:hypothetical protein